MERIKGGEKRVETACCCWSNTPYFFALDWRHLNKLIQSEDKGASMLLSWRGKFFLFYVGWLLDFPLRGRGDSTIRRLDAFDLWYLAKKQKSIFWKELKTDETHRLLEIRAKRFLINLNKYHSRSYTTVELGFFFCPNAEGEELVSWSYQGRLLPLMFPSISKVDAVQHRRQRLRLRWLRLQLVTSFVSCQLWSLQACNYSASAAVNVKDMRSLQDPPLLSSPTSRRDKNK